MIESATLVIWGIVAVVGKACLFLGMTPEPQNLITINPFQKTFVEQYFSKYSDTNKFSEKELRSWVSRDANELNALLKKEGFDIQLEPWEDPRGFGVVSILDLLGEWQHKGKKSTITTDDKKEYPAVCMDAGFSVQSTAKHPNPLLSVHTKSGDRVWMTIADEPRHGFELYDYIRGLQAEQKEDDRSYTGARFPMLDLNEHIKLDWLIELQLGDENYISQAQQQNILKMNEMGFRVKSATALEVRCTACLHEKKYKDLNIDKPFFLWIERPENPEPIFAGYITEKYWRDPEGLTIPSKEEIKRPTTPSERPYTSPQRALASISRGLRNMAWRLIRPVRSVDGEAESKLKEFYKRQDGEYLYADNTAVFDGRTALGKTMGELRRVFPESDPTSVARLSRAILLARHNRLGRWKFADLQLVPGRGLQYINETGWTHSRDEDYEVTWNRQPKRERFWWTIRYRRPYTYFATAAKWGIEIAAVAACIKMGMRS